MDILVSHVNVDCMKEELSLSFGLCSTLLSLVRGEKFTSQIQKDKSQRMSGTM